MKKKQFIIFLCFLGISSISKAQDFEPGVQAQGYLNDKNVTVDYSTGIFHYKIPLYTLGTGDFQLPFYLEYSAQGVKREDQHGLIDYNWTLNTGGVVTRTIRGGIADETIFYGYLWTSRKSTVPLVEDIANVNKHERDGESDIFTAVFNNQSVNFIIKSDRDFEIHAEPLEKTNVRIECELDNNDIAGWIVTDENGNRYVYKQKEWTNDINKEDAISYNGIRNKSYVSTWHLNRIEPANGEPIVFNYSYKLMNHEKILERDTTRYDYYYKSKYFYGKPMHERLFNFFKYKHDFDMQLKEASDYIGHFNIEEINTNILEFEAQGKWVLNPFYSTSIENRNMNHRVLGQIVNWSRITNASNEVIQQLTSLIKIYGNQTSTNARMAAACFRTAKSLIIRSIDEICDTITTKETSGGTSYVIYSPILESVYCADKFIMFQHENRVEQGLYKGSKYITGIKLCDVFKQRVSEVRFKQGSGLSRISFLNKDSVEVKHMEFTYYPRPSEFMTTLDAWGYPRKRQIPVDNNYNLIVDNEYSKTRSLKTIKTVDGGTITLDYESNRVIPHFVPSVPDTTRMYGGIRLKSLIFDYGAGIPDTISYSYGPGILVYFDYTNKETLNYGNFSDDVLYSRVQFNGPAFLNTGNNGIYYSHVQEKSNGKGTRVYMFHPASYFQWKRPVAEPYSFWLNGLLLTTAVYDDNDNLKEVIKNVYATDMQASPELYDFYNAHFCQGDTVLNYKRKLPQVKPYEYYMDGSIGQYYKEQGNIPLYFDEGRTQLMNPYNEMYLPNISPREHILVPKLDYTLCYGGKTLLKEQLYYKFESHVTDSINPLDILTKITGKPFQKTEYFYDNVRNSILPTRVVKTDSRGDRYTLVTKRVTEIDNNANPVIVKMKQKNLLSPIVKQLHLRNDVITDEIVTLYESRDTGNTCYITPSEQHVFYPGNTIRFSPSATDGNLFTNGRSNYKLEQTLVNEQKNHASLPVESIDISGDTTLFFHDFARGQLIMKAKNVKRQGVAVADMKKYENVPSGQEQVLGITVAYEAFQKFNKEYPNFQRVIRTSDYYTFSHTPQHGYMLKLIEAIATSGATASYDELCSLVDSVWSNSKFYAHEFGEKYKTLAAKYPGMNVTSEDINYIEMCVCNEFYMKPIVLLPDFMKYSYLTSHKDVLQDESPLQITIFPKSKRVRLFVVTNSSCYIDYTINHARGTSSNYLNYNNKGGYSVQSRDIDLSIYDNVRSVTLKRPFYNVVYLALVPIDATFEAISYNPDGSVFCKFDQNCQTELNEYDTAGRLIRVKDQNSKVIKEYHYNMVQNN